jgi:hypothetical protein
VIGLAACTWGALVAFVWIAALRIAREHRGRP